MLIPSDRRLLLDALAPPEGFGLDQAVGTTYTLDLLALLRVPLAATSLPWSEADGAPVSNPFALLSALRSHADRITLFCQAGAIKVPPRQQTLFAFLEGCVNQVLPPRGGVFHPKLWLLRFTRASDDTVVYRLLVLSRNLTFDRCWDIALVLDGKLTNGVHRINRPLGDLLASLPAMAQAAGQALTPTTGKRIALMDDEVRRISWENPEDFELVEFHALGLDDRPRWPFADLYKLMVVSPFVAANALANLAEVTHHAPRLIARFEELTKLPMETLDAFEEVMAFDDGQGLLDADNPNGDGTVEELSGLHAKLFLGEAARRVRLWVGSSNATEAGLGSSDAAASNVEFLAQLGGVRSRHGIEVTRSALFDAGLTRPFCPGADRPPDDGEEALQRALERTATELASGALGAAVITEGPDRHRVELHRTSRGLAIDPTMSVEIRPITLQAGRRAHFDREPVATFPVVALVHLTPFFAFSIMLEHEGIEKRHDFVARLDLTGVPDGRTEAVIAELLSDSDRLLAFLLLLLAVDGGDAERAIDELARLGEGKGRSGGTASNMGLPLLEPLLRALDRDPERLDQIGTLLGQLSASEQTAELVPEELRALWQTIEAVRGA